MSENGNGLEKLPQKIKPPTSDSQEEWEKYLSAKGMPANLENDPREINLSILADFGRRHQPEGYDSGNDLFIGESYDLGEQAKLNQLAYEDSSQCDARIGLQYALKNMDEFEQYLVDEKIVEEDEDPRSFWSVLGIDTKDEGKALSKLAKIFDQSSQQSDKSEIE